MGSTQVRLEKMEARRNYADVWHTDLMRAPESDPLFCCFALLCGPCASYMLRKRALYDDMSRYTCCGGYMPCSGRCGESNCPKFCLCTEVFLCFVNSVAATRFMLQDEFSIQTTKCDNCIIGFMFCLQQLACIFSIIALLVGSDDIEEAAHLLNCLSDMVYCTVCPCMQTQHKAEMDKRNGKFGAPSLMAVPPVQQMSRMDQPIPPLVGYPTPPPYGHPPGYPPPPSAYGPPPGYLPPPFACGPPPDYPLPPPAHGQPTAYSPPPPRYVQPHGYPLPPPPPPPQRPPSSPSPQMQPQPQPQPHQEGHPSPLQPQSQGYPPASYPPPGCGYPPANYPTHSPPDYGR